MESVCEGSRHALGGSIACLRRCAGCVHFADAGACLAVTGKLAEQLRNALGSHASHGTPAPVTASAAAPPKQQARSKETSLAVACAYHAIQAHASLTQNLCISEAVRVQAAQRWHDESIVVGASAESASLVLNTKHWHGLQASCQSFVDIDAEDGDGSGAESGDGTDDDCKGAPAHAVACCSEPRACLHEEWDCCPPETVCLHLHAHPSCVHICACTFRSGLP